MRATSDTKPASIGNDANHWAVKGCVHRWKDDERVRVRKVARGCDPKHNDPLG